MRITGVEMRVSRIRVLLAATIVASGCSDPTFAAIELTGIWVASSHEYESESGELVDIVERDGASTSLSVDRSPTGWRVSVSHRDGMGGTEVMAGEVDEDQFVFESRTWRFTRDGDQMTVTDSSSSFDFGDGPEPAELTIRLTRL